jgi:hypothetical protein
MSKLTRNCCQPWLSEVIRNNPALVHIRVYDDAIRFDCCEADPPWPHRQSTAATRLLLTLAVRLVCLGAEEVLELGRVGELDFAEPSCGEGSAGSAGFGRSQRSSSRGAGGSR